MEVDKTIGAVNWMDITIPDADGLRDFYANVIGWKIFEIDMGEYKDYCMISPSDDVVRSGICHLRGVNEGLPPVWLPYVNVADLDASIEAVRKGGGEIVNGPRKMGETSRYCTIKDPEGAYIALFQH